MKAISKFLTPALTANDRKKIERMLGLDQVRFLYHESSVGFSHLFNVPGGFVAALPDSQVDHWLSEHTLDFAMVMEQSGRKNFSITLPNLERLGLWESLMPFPLDLFAIREKFPQSIALRVFPSVVEAEIYQLQSRINELEEKLFGYEAALLWLGSGEERFPLLLHFVRKKLVRVGTAERLFELGERFESGHLNEQQLDQAMGTRARFLPLNVFHDPGASPLQNLAGAVERAHLHLIDDPQAFLATSFSTNHSRLS